LLIIQIVILFFVNNGLRLHMTEIYNTVSNVKLLKDEDEDEDEDVW